MSDAERTRARGRLSPFPLTLVPLAGVLLVAAAQASEIHRWKDADGRVHYGDKPPPGVAAKQIAKSPPAAPVKASPEVRVEESVVRAYDISGASIAELNQAAQRSGPVSKSGGGRVWGMCTWQVAWSYSTTGGAGKCAVEKFSITVSAVLDLPRWTNQDAAPDSVRSSWERFAAALRLHEDGHKDIGVRAANDLGNRLRALGPEKTCAELHGKVGALGERVVAEYRVLDQAYDRSTGNGMTQGAVLK